MFYWITTSDHGTYSDVRVYPTRNVRTTPDKLLENILKLCEHISIFLIYHYMHNLLYFGQYIG